MSHVSAVRYNARWWLTCSTMHIVFMHGNFTGKQANFQISGFRIIYSSVVLQFIIPGIRLRKTLVLFQMKFFLHHFLVSTEQLIWNKWNFFIISHRYLLKEHTSRKSIYSMVTKKYQIRKRTLFLSFQINFNFTSVC